ncbi:MAG: carbohydrate binding family 9 domain-containing protein [Candidatus Marinimicrobia bacterium]|nr:carbohydrate binding family 9 domain-containing protein [Candidatus Neomarinimicrobiota bacterium]
MKYLQTVIPALLVFAGSAQGGDPELDKTDKFVPNIKPILEVRKTTGKIVIDGDLNDAGWIGAARATNFTQTEPTDMVKPQSNTTALITYDDDNLYIAVIAMEDDPSSIRSSLRDRDRIFSDDLVGFILDTYGDASWAYEVFANPDGIQGDLRWTQRGEDTSFDIVFKSEGKLTPEGYQVEFAIPFASLRFPDKNVQDWKITFWRIRPRESREEYSWAAISKNDPNFLGQFGSLEGIENVKPGKSFEILPSITSSQAASRDLSVPGSSFQNGDISGDASIGIRYGITSNTSIEGTINPDFSQVESDVAQIDVNNTFALFFPERRPFFQEGSDLFGTWYNVVYTRTINDPSFATKLTSRTNKFSYAYIGAVDERSPLVIPGEERSKIIADLGKSYSNILRVRRSFNDDSHFGFIAVDRRIEGGGSGSNFSFDSNIRFKKIYNVELQGVLSHTAEVDDTTLTEGLNQTVFDNDGHTVGLDGESYYGNAVYASVERHARGWSFDFDYWHQTPTYRSDNGFQTRNHRRQGSIYNQYNFYPENSFFVQIQPAFNLIRIWNWDGIIKDNAISPRLFLRMKGQTTVYVQYTYGPETFKGKKFTDQQNAYGEIFTKFTDLIGGGFWVFTGRTIARNEAVPFSADVMEFGINGTIKPFDRLVIEPKLNHFKLQDTQGNELSNGYVFRARTEYQFTKELFLRLVVQYNDFSQRLNIEPLLTYKINPFSVFFVGSTHGSVDNLNNGNFVQTDRQYFMKFQYLFRI